ncbi:uncharacterized protein LOC119326491 isoform X1 [Triticum dicoccoides]|uniref:uncharacterized protein LOC119326491 isoform X1 n=1 Tax=Triticum dicoccoides TaxID=85692 RepID=UPI00188FBDCA|nr:uncharacterized protein LOC119326491 isoform X1 [Triticum dicoccoides]
MSDGREQGRAKRPAVWSGAARLKTGQRTPHGVEERPVIGKSSIFMDEILTAEDGAHGRSLEDVKVSFSQSFSPSRPLQILLVSDHMKGRREEWRIEVVGCQLQILGLRKELKAEVMVASFNFLLSNSSRVFPRSEDEGKKKNLTKQLKKIKDLL